MEGKNWLVRLVVPVPGSDDFKVYNWGGWARNSAIALDRAVGNLGLDHDDIVDVVIIVKPG